jgi:hypothetical protein
MLVPRFLTRGIEEQVVAAQPELGRNELRHRRRDQLARRKHAARIAQDAELQRETETVVGTPALPDVPEILIAESVMLQQITLIDRQAEQRFALAIGQGYATRHICSFFFRRKGLIQLDCDAG